MKRTDSFLNTTKNYLFFLNDPATFARQRGIPDQQFLRYLQVRSEAMKLQIRERGAIIRRTRKVIQDLKSRVHAETLQDVVDAMKDPERIPDANRLKKFAQEVASGGLHGAIERLFDDAFPNIWPTERWPQWHARNERRAMNLISKIAPVERLQRIHDRLHVCRLCERFFVRDLAKQAQRAQQYCPTCRGRWSKQQLWYRTMVQLWKSAGLKPNPRLFADPHIRNQVARLAEDKRLQQLRRPARRRHR